MKPIAASVVASLFLTGCGPSFPTIDSAALAEAVSQVQKHTVQICSYLPSNNSVVSILTASNPIVETAFAIATQICNAVTATVPPVTPTQMQEPKRGEANQCPMVRGVCIEGQFIQPTTKDQAPNDGTLNKEPQP
jgi:hypothetical protein